jgi:small subunit ribosomal protein S17
MKQFVYRCGRVLQRREQRGNVCLIDPLSLLRQSQTVHLQQTNSWYQTPKQLPIRFLSTMLSPIDDDPFPNFPMNEMTNEELADPSTIPGWNLIHSPPRTIPRGALMGTVVSDKMDKTVNVAVVRYRVVPKVRKRVRYTRKFMAHDENEVANMGDTVMITPCHRISKNKHFMLREIIRSKGQL